ncbi:MAG: FtsW/RodA/SpoVE family cell cycle protein [Candidatus Saccharibacteria bacterium]
MRSDGVKTLTRSLMEKSQSDDLVLSRKHRPDYMVVLYMGLLMLLGLIIIYAIGPQRANVLNNAYGSDYTDTYFFIKQLVSLLVSLGAFAAMAFIPFKWVMKYARSLVLVALGLCLLLAVASVANLGIAQESLGATRWFNLGALGSFQPAELLKFALLAFIALFLGNKARQDKQNDIKETLIPLGAITAVAMFFIVIVQKDLGTGIALAGIILAMLLVSKINLRNGVMIAGLVAVVGVIVIVSAPHRVERLMTFLKGDNSSLEISGDSESYHVEHAKLAIGSGGLFGVGVGNSVQATGYLPEAINDSVFAIMGETFGFVGLVVILALFTALLTRLLKIMDNLADIRLRLLVAGVFGWLAAHVMLNVASMIGLAPLTGITLPLLSFGGTSMAFIAAALGLVFQLSSYTVFSSNLKEAQYEDSNRRRGIGRSRHSSRGGFTRN